MAPVSGDTRLPTHGGLTPAALGRVVGRRRTECDFDRPAPGSPDHGGLTPAALGDDDSRSWRNRFPLPARYSRLLWNIGIVTALENEEDIDDAELHAGQMRILTALESEEDLSSEVGACLETLARRLDGAVGVW
jgi:hypothetical protein